MIDPMKYIIIERRGLETPVIFPCWLNHDEAAAGKKVISAGKVRIKAEMNLKDNLVEVSVKCFGESISMKVKSRPEEDAFLIKQMIEAPNE